MCRMDTIPPQRVRCQAIKFGFGSKGSASVLSPSIRGENDKGSSPFGPGDHSQALCFSCHWTKFSDTATDSALESGAAACILRKEGTNVSGSRTADGVRHWGEDLDW